MGTGVWSEGLQVDVETPLAVLTTAIRALQLENETLRKQLFELKTSRHQKWPGHDLSERCTAEGTTCTNPDAQEMERQRRSDKAPQVGARTFQRKLQHSSAADLSRLIADLDPDEEGTWASSCLRADEVFEMLSGSGSGACTMKEAEELMHRFRQHCEAQEPIQAATKLQFVKMTSTGRLQDVFGADGLERVLALQGALADQLTEALIEENPSGRQSRTSIHFRSMSDFKMNVLREDWRVLVARTTRQEILDTMGTFFVILNTLILGVSTDVTPGWNGWDYVSSIFAVLFLIELCAKICVAGGIRAYYFGGHGEWRLFDTFVILIALLDVCIMIMTIGEAMVDARAITIMRIVRLARLTRITRLGNIGAFSELSYMIRGIEAGTSTLVWALVLLVLVCYVGAILLTQTIGRSSADYFRPYAERHFSSVLLSMFTLFRCFTGDCSTYEGTPLSYILYDQYGAISVVVYWMLMMVVTFGLFNVMIANFLQNSQRAARFNDVERRRMLRKERKMVHEKTTSLMNRILELCADKKGHRGSVSDLEISRDVFHNLLKDREIHRWFEDMGCDDGLRETLFDKVDRDGNGILTAQELVTGAVDMLRGRFDNMEKVTNMLRAIQTRLVEIEGFSTVVCGQSSTGSLLLPCRTVRC